MAGEEGEASWVAGVLGEAETMMSLQGLLFCENCKVVFNRIYTFKLGDKNG